MLQSWVNFSLFHGFADIFTHPVCWVVTQNPCWLTIKEITTVEFDDPAWFLGDIWGLSWLLGIPGCPNAQVMIPMCVWWMRGTGRLKVASPASSGSSHTARGSPHWKFLRIFGNNSPLGDCWGEEWGGLGKNGAGTTCLNFCQSKIWDEWMRIERWFGGYNPSYKQGRYG